MISLKVSGWCFRRQQSKKLRFQGSALEVKAGPVGLGVGVEEFRKNLMGILREFHENFIETACISDIYCIK
jgi:hypothetical protein